MIHLSFVKYSLLDFMLTENIEPKIDPCERKPGKGGWFDGSGAGSGWSEIICNHGDPGRWAGGQRGGVRPKRPLAYNGTKCSAFLGFYCQNIFTL